MIATAPELVLELQRRGVVAGGADVAVADHGSDRPWYIGLLLGTAGWVAGVFILVFVAMLFKPDGSASAIVAGAVLLAAAWGLFKVDREGAFVSQLALALSVAGQFALLYGLGELLVRNVAREFALIAFLALVLQVALVGLMPNALHRTMSALFACTAWVLLVRYGLWDRSAPWTSGRPPAPSVALAVVGWAVAWLPVAGALYMVVRREAEWIASGRQAIVRPAAIGLILALAVTTLLSQPFDTFPFWRDAHGRGGFSLWPLLSALAALGALVGAFALGSRGLTAVCVIAALIHVSHFYYAMGTSLLVKALTMVALGALLLYGAREARRSR